MKKILKKIKKRISKYLEKRETIADMKRIVKDSKKPILTQDGTLLPPTDVTVSEIFKQLKNGEAKLSGSYSITESGTIFIGVILKDKRKVMFEAPRSLRKRLEEAGVSNRLCNGTDKAFL